MSSLKHLIPAERLVTAVQELSLARDMQSVMKIVRTVARELTGADGATFILRQEEQCFYADEDAIGPLWKDQRFPLTRCISGWVMLNKQPVIIEDIYKDDRIPHDAYKPTFVKSLAMVPIRTLNPIGAIGNYWAEKTMPGSTELKLLQALADITAVTLENIRMYSELEQRVQERTRQLELVNNELEAFSYTVSHDLRAPLRSMKLNLEQLKRKNETLLDEVGHTLISKVMRRSEEMTQLIDDLLTFFMLSKTDLEKQQISIPEMLSAICAEVQEQNPDRKIRFIVKDMPDVVADKTLLKQLWNNLVNNAVKYSKYKEEAVIEIGTEKVDNKINYYIKDNGAGFNMKYYDRLFNVFQRLHSKEQFEGTGIGLAIVSRVVAKHNGRVWAESEIDKGSKFSFTLNEK
jgi:K+-sensing histidine kinase KdpD